MGKTIGAYHIYHALAHLLRHQEDADKQRLQKGGRAAFKVRRKLARLATRMLERGWAPPEEEGIVPNGVPKLTPREASLILGVLEQAGIRVKVPEDVKPEAASEAPSKKELRFPEFAGGLTSIRANVTEPWVDGRPAPGVYEIHGPEGTDRVLAWTAEVGDRHAGYRVEREKSATWSLRPPPARTARSRRITAYCPRRARSLFGIRTRWRRQRPRAWSRLRT